MITTHPEVYIIIVNWNNERYLPSLFKSLYNMIYKDFRIIFVDNGSSDNSVEWVKKHYPETVIIKNKRNLGFAEGNNIGIRYALRKEAKYVALLNTDIVVDKDWLWELIKPMELDKNIGVVGSKILFMDYPWIINSAGVTVNIDMYARDRDFGRIDGEISREGSVIAVSGGAMAARAALFNQIGLFDKFFFTYYEDVDLCLRIRRYTYYDIIYNPYSVVFHKLWGSSNGNTEPKYFFSSRNHYIIKFRYLPIRKIPFRVLRTLKVKIERCFFWKSVLKEFKAFLSALMYLPLSIIKRILMDIRYGINYSYMDLLENTKGIPEHIPYPPDYAERREKLFPDRLPSHIIFGVNDDFIGNGWSLLLDNDGLKFRKIVSDYAEVFLSSPNTGKHFLQFHISGESNIRIYFESKIVGKFKPVGVWETVIFPITINKRKPYYKIRIEGKGTKMNEIALLTPTSPLLRKRQ